MLIDQASRRAVLGAMAAVGSMAGLTAPAKAARQDGAAWRQAEALADIKDRIEAFYVFPERRGPLIAAIEAAERSGSLDLPTATAFADQLTQVMQDAVGDKHLRLVFNPEWVEAFEAPQPEGEDSGEFDRQAIRDHFGIVQTRHLPGNIRCARIIDFGWVNGRGEAAYDGLMGFLADASAIIIDIRGNGGGDHSAVRYLVSHFLAPETPLYRFESTREPSWESRSLAGLPAGRVSGVPLYVLIDNRTVSAGEDLAYQVQQYRLGDLVGSTTAGAANNNELFAVAGLYRFSLSVGRPVHPVSGTNWEGRGVDASIPTPAHDAFDRAIIAAADRLATDSDATRIQRAEWAWSKENAQARLAPTAYTISQLRRYRGQYVDHAVVLRDRSLWLEVGSQDPLRLTAMHERGLFAIEGRDFTRVRLGPSALELLMLGAPEPRRYPRL